MEIRKADFKQEKHVPVIEILEKGEVIRVKVQVGKEISHPNKPEHHIKFIELYFLPESGVFPLLIGRASFEAHGEAEVFTEPVAYFEFRARGKGKLIALAFCNIHGLWESETEL